MSVEGLLWRTLLWGPSLLIEGISRCRAMAYRHGILETVRVPAPVFCVGNLTVGGSGKTPGVLWLVEELKKRGHRPAVVTRGYGRRNALLLMLIPHGIEPLPDAETMGDEPRLLARRSGVSIAISADRALACERAWEQFKPDCLVMDDGFQHHRIHRDRDFVCLDAQLAHSVFLSGLPTPLLPAGPWREKPSALTRAHLIFVTRAERLTGERLGALQKCLGDRGLKVVPVFGRMTFQDNVTGETVSPAWFKDQRVLALSGLGDPASFEKALSHLGANVAGARYGDHHFFSLQEWAGALKRAHLEGRCVVITEKDRERLPEDFPALVARLDWQLEKEDVWAPVIESVFS